MTAYRYRAADAKLVPSTALCEVDRADALKVARIAGAMQRGDLFDPIIIDGQHRVVDGKHRVAASRAGYDRIPAVESV
jgi:ParB-like chromosome segregation protein Spo0J